MAFRDFNIDLAQGEFLGVSGPSGIGKSTLLKTIYRTYRADSGTVLYRSASKGEVDLLALDEHDMLELRETEIAYVSQFFQVMPRVSAMGILLSALAHRGLSDAECRERAAAMLERVCLPRHLWELYPSTFSGGEKQRLNIAHALLSSPAPPPGRADGIARRGRARQRPHAARPAQGRGDQHDRHFPRSSITAETGRRRVSIRADGRLDVRAYGRDRGGNGVTLIDKVRLVTPAGIQDDASILVEGESILETGSGPRPEISQMIDRRWPFWPCRDSSTSTRTPSKARLNLARRLPRDRARLLQPRGEAGLPRRDRNLPRLA